MIFKWFILLALLAMMIHLPFPSVFAQTLRSPVQGSLFSRPCEFDPIFLAMADSRSSLDRQGEYFPVHPNRFRGEISAHSGSSLSAVVPESRCSETSGRSEDLQPNRPVRHAVRGFLQDVSQDYRHFYRCSTGLNFGVALGGAAILANTSMDMNFQNWYQREVRCSALDDVGHLFKGFGDGIIVIPVLAVSTLTYRSLSYKNNWDLKERPVASLIDRSTRAYAVGAPVLLLSQILTGAGRPDGQNATSHWKPFDDDSGVSGHAFVGAIPLITAAQMTDQPLVKGLFYALSIGPAWSRVNRNAHYLSQSILGWYLAYLSVRSVTETETPGKLPKGLTIFPVLEGNGALGVGLSWKR